MDFLICYEHVVREIENDTLLKYELEKRGYSCKIIHFNDADYCLHSTKEKAKVVVTPWLRYDNNVYHYLRLAKKPYKLVNLQWEQVYSKGADQREIVKTVGQALKAYHVCWGSNSKNRLIRLGGDENKLPILGAIQMDYGSELFRDYYLPREAIAEQFGLDGNRNWNLLISNFAYANYGDEAILSLEKKHNTPLRALAELHKKSQKITLDWVEKLLAESDCEFIYRPHPSERVDQRLESMVEKYPRFHVIKDYAVKQWVSVCDKVNLWTSTSNAETLSLKVNYAIVRPIEVPEEEETESMVNEEFITEYEDFLHYNMTYGEADPTAIAERMARIEPYYSYNADRPAYKRIADFLEEVLKSEEGQTFHFTLGQRVRFGIKEKRLFVVSKLMRKCLLHGSTKPVEYLPIKAEIKKNIGIALEKRRTKEATEARMTEYLRSHDQ